ncbi:hypothetical protein VNO78_30404 [Psophocarpus tetragonolobus]|uniref:Uncharacterized protein n=1 Tax=Psophocarpus tetragonolobus TaxID=3891 RepID=A0AAN9X4L7_PSOTE
MPLALWGVVGLLVLILANGMAYEIHSPVAKSTALWQTSFFMNVESWSLLGQLGVSICLHAIGIVGCGWPVGVDSCERDGVVRIGPCVAYLFKVLCRLCYDSVRTSSLGSRRN